MHISDLRGVKSGEVVVLGNGPSLQKQIPYLDGVDTIGVNASLQYHPSGWHCALDQESLLQIPEMKYEADVLFTTNLPYRLPKVKTEVVALRTRHHDIAWSNDLEDCIYSGKATLWFALQVAAWLGYEDIYITGFDLAGERPEGHLRAGQEIPYSSVTRQLELMGYLRGLIDCQEVKQRFYLCTWESPCVSIPKINWQTREFVKSGVYEPAMDVDISITRRSSRIGGGRKLADVRV